MRDEEKTKEQLIDELGKVRQRVTELEALEVKLTQAKVEIYKQSKEWIDVSSRETFCIDRRNSQNILRKWLAFLCLFWVSFPQIHRRWTWDTSQTDCDSKSSTDTFNVSFRFSNTSKH